MFVPELLDAYKYEGKGYQHGGIPNDLIAFEILVIVDHGNRREHHGRNNEAGNQSKNEDRFFISLKFC